MKKIKSNSVFWILSVFAAGFLVDAVVISKFSFNYRAEITFIDIFNICTTIVITLYLANVVEATREVKKANDEVILNVIKSTIQECDFITHKLYEKSLDYTQAVHFPKKLHTTGKELKKLLELLDLNSNDSIVLINKIIEVRSLRKNLTSIKTKKDCKFDYLEVMDNHIHNISPNRISKILKDIESKKDLLYQLWIHINSAKI